MQIDDVSRILLHVQNNHHNLVIFSNIFFSLSNVDHSFSKLKRVLTLVIIEAKEFEIGNFHFKVHLNIFISNMLLTLKIMNLKNASLTSGIHFCVI
jgi:hypothetical protein